MHCFAKGTTCPTCDNFCTHLGSWLVSKGARFVCLCRLCLCRQAMAMALRTRLSQSMTFSMASMTSLTRGVAFAAHAPRPMTHPAVSRWSRGFSTERPQRVIAAVERYMKARKDDLLRDDSGTENREEALKALDSAVSTGTKWDELKFDEIDKVEVLLEVEDEFNHVIPDADADSINSVQEILNYLEKAGVN